MDDAAVTDALLSVLTNETSSFPAVSQTCWTLSQMAGDVDVDDEWGGGGTATANALVPPDAFAAFWSRAWRALGTCLAQHADRRCRIRAARTLAIAAKAAYAQLRPSPLLISQAHDSTTTVALRAVEDEVASDVAMLLCTATLEEDQDDGVAAACLNSLGLLLGTGSSCTYGGLLEDELAVHMSVLQCRGGGPYTPSMRSVVDEDVGVVLQELGLRIVENVVAPRLLPLTDRVVRMRGECSSQNVADSLPCLTTALVYAVAVHPVTLFHTDRSTFSKRWGELDVAGLIDGAVIPTLIVPALQNSMCGPLAIAASFAALRLAHAQPTKHWVTPVCMAVVTVLREECDARQQATGTKLALLAAIVVATRAIPMLERTFTLIWLIEHIGMLPSTVSSPVVGAGLRIEPTKPIASASVGTEGLGRQPSCSYRYPTRVALWTEIALGFFLDGPTGSSGAPPMKVASSLSPRSECLRKFVQSPFFIQIVQPKSGFVLKGPISICDELLLSFASVALETGRRFRKGGNGTFHLVDSLSCNVQVWLVLVEVVLGAFTDCLFAPTSGHYLDEDMSLSTAGLAKYVQLLQEYLFFVGLLHPSNSVSLTMGSNACPPHILWDRMSESAAFLSSLESTDLECMDVTTQFLDKLVSREMKEGIPSHHVRLFVLTLAADHWVQCRASLVRKHSDATKALSKSNADGLNFNMQGGREILLALAPKRLLDKISHAPPPSHDVEGKVKKDPIKKMAIEIVRVSVACIENVALMACDWRRRFGSSQESKHIVSVAVGLLQGKIDETPVNDLMKAVLGPVCDAAVNRIQAFYESSGQGPLDQAFPVSALVNDPVKVKIKPLVSSSKPIVRANESFMPEYLMQLCRQVVESRIQLSVEAATCADFTQTPARPVNWLRLSAPPLPESTDGRMYGSHGQAMSAWNHSVKNSSAASDPVQLIVAYTPRRCLRYDGDDEYRIEILMKAFNMTALHIFQGLQLDLTIIENTDCIEDDNLLQEQIECLGSNVDFFCSNLPLVSTAAEYPHELKSGEYITWSTVLNNFFVSNSFKIVPSVVFRNVSEEADDIGVTLIGENATDGEGNAAEQQNGEDDFQVTKSDESKSFKEAGMESKNVRLIGEPLTLPPLIVCQPCPLVFFNSRCGDLDSFRFLWFRLPFSLAPLTIVDQSDQSANPTTRKISTMASLMWEGEAVPGGVATNLWAFQTLSGHRILCVLTESETPEAQSEQNLFFRGDSKPLLFSLICSKEARDSVVSAMIQGKMSFY